MDYLDKFNQTFREFGEDIIKVFPNDNEFHMYNMAIQAAVMINPEIVLNIFHERVIVPFGERILAKDESFFLSHDYNDVKTSHEDASAIIDKVKSYWTVMNDTNREVVWKYFKVLVRLGQKIRT